ncbi:hypothetical protein [uncultured Dechloromonas sp.]|uniref:hypothetical protein n=1 Tax=uncultured Dechloromonas sp. TaxID=171719 RepID=UPI0025CDA751|nr:hypothetical protein [uncultured Dechloromonas sp.]
MIDPDLYDKARDHIAHAGFSPEVQTKIALTLCAAKAGNQAFHNAVQWLPNLGVVQQFMISQAARELEAINLLTRTTQWSARPNLAMTALRTTAPLTLAWTQIMMPPGPLFNPPAIYQGLSLGHAQLARLRLLPLIPEDANPFNPFVVALQRIEQDNGRMLQTQIRLLKRMGENIPLDAREQMLERDQQVVDQVFSEFMSWLVEP